jgi:hypothetical protein
MACRRCEQLGAVRPFSTNNVIERKKLVRPFVSRWRAAVPWRPLATIRRPRQRCGAITEPQHYGTSELRTRFPDDGRSKAVPLNMLTGVLLTMR